MPGRSGVTVVTNSCAFYYCIRGCGRIARPAFPAPSDDQMAGNSLAKLGCTPRDRKGVFKIGATSLPAANAKRLRKGALATKQSTLSFCRSMDCFAMARNDDFEISWLFEIWTSFQRVVPAKAGTYNHQRP